MNHLTNDNDVMICCGYRMTSSSDLVDQSRSSCYVVPMCWNLSRLLAFGWMRMLVLLIIFKLYISS
jgi:hypothetical protein